MGFHAYVNEMHGSRSKITSKKSRQAVLRGGIPANPSEMEPATFRLVPQCLNQLRHRVYLICSERLSARSLEQTTYFHCGTQLKIVQIHPPSSVRFNEVVLI
jgi:hypothetical protein